MDDFQNNEFEQGYERINVNMDDVPKVDMGKYNERIKFLENLRKEAMRDLNDIEDDLGLNDHSFIESNEAKSYSPKKLSPPKVSPRKK